MKTMWELPKNNIFNKSLFNNRDFESTEKAARLGDIIADKFGELGARLNPEKIDIGPQIIRFNMVAAEGVPIRTLSKYRDEIAYEIGSKSVRILAPVPGQRVVGVEIENPEPYPVLLGDVVDFSEAPLTFPLGIGPDGSVINCKIPQAPHLLVSGTTGSGKSTMLNSMICSLLSANTPDDLNFMMIDTKQTELIGYENIPHLVTPVITDAYEAIEKLEVLVGIMELRYEEMRRNNVRKIDELNENQYHKLPYIFVIIDEVADLMLISKRAVEESIVRIAQKARACGIHLIISTQTPRREIITGILKANLPSRICFQTTSALDSRIVLDQKGGEELLGNGDSLFSDQGRNPIRVQPPYVNSNEINSIVNHWSNQNVMV